MKKDEYMMIYEFFGPPYEWFLLIGRDSHPKTPLKTKKDKRYYTLKTSYIKRLTSLISNFVSRNSN